MTDRPSSLPYNVGDLDLGRRRKAPAAARNIGPIGDVLADWLPATGRVLEVASGTGEHALAFARRFPALQWLPSDRDPDALASIAAWREKGPSNLLPPLAIDASERDWPVESADAILSVNMVHISPWESALGLLAESSRLLPSGGSLMLYGPWLEEGIAATPSNLEFNQMLKARDPRWGLRLVEDFAREAQGRGLRLVDRRPMPANNLMLRFLRD